MCKHAAHTTDKENCWIEYFLYDANKDDVDFPALTARVQDGRRGKVSVITYLAAPPAVKPTGRQMATLPRRHQDGRPDSLSRPLVLLVDLSSVPISALMRTALRGWKSASSASCFRSRGGNLRFSESSLLLQRFDDAFTAKLLLFPETLSYRHTSSCPRSGTSCRYHA